MTFVPKCRVAGVAALLAFAAPAFASQVKTPFVQSGRDGTLKYTADARGDRVPDFSRAGYGGGGVALPVASARARVSPAPGDAGPRIQAAIDYIAGLAPDASGLRGAVVLERGRYEIAGQLRIGVSGVVLRGQGAGENDTVLVATGTDRRTLIQVAGRDDRTKRGNAHAIADAYVAVGATTFTVDRPETFHVGDRVLIERPSTKEWIAAIGMDDAPARQPFSWQPGKMNLAWERTIVAIDSGHLTLDAPITTALDRTFGGATVTACTSPGRLTQVGIENLRCESACAADNPKDEAHAWMAISLDAWRCPRTL